MVIDNIRSQPSREFDRWDRLEVVVDGEVKRSIPTDPKHFHNLDVEQCYVEPLRAFVVDKQPLSPITLHLGPTNACFLNCQNCWAGSVHASEQLSLKEMQGVLQQARELGTCEVRFHGPGEPTYNRSTLEAIEFASQIGLKTALFTNGLRLTDEYIDRLMAQPNFMLLWISTKAEDPAKYAEVTGVAPNAYKRVLERVEAVGEARLKRKDDIVLKGTSFISKWTYDSFAEKAAFLKANHFDAYKGELHFPTFTEALRDHPEDIRRNVEELRRLESKDFITNYHEIPTVFDPNYSRYKTPPPKCYIAGARLYIDGKGDCYPCIDWIDNSTQRGYSLGNIREQNLREIWEGEKRRMLAMMDGSDKGEHPFCTFCATPQPNEVLKQMIDALTEYPNAQFRKVFRPGYEPAS